MKILVAQTIYPGDLVLTLPLLQHLRAGFPDAGLDVLVSRGMEDLVSSHPSVSEVLTYDKTGPQRGWRNVSALARNLRSRNYSLALVLPGSVRTALAVCLARIPRRIGTDQSSGMLLFADTVKFPRKMVSSANARSLLLAEKLWKAAGGNNSVVSPLFTDIVRLDRFKNAIGRHLQLLEPLGISVKEELSRPRLYPRDDDISAVDEAMSARSGEDLIALAPGSTWSTKRWPVEKFAGLVSALLERRVAPVIVGGREDRVLAEEVAGNFPPELVLDVCGRLTFLQSAELLRRCRVLVTNDTAVMHIAAAMGTPCVALFGPTVPEFGFAPVGDGHIILETYGLSCRPCTPHGGEKCPVGTHECMTGITVEATLAAVDRVLMKKRVDE